MVVFMWRIDDTGFPLTQYRTIECTKDVNKFVEVKKYFYNLRVLNCKVEIEE